MKYRGEKREFRFEKNFFFFIIQLRETLFTLFTGQTYSITTDLKV